MLGAQVCVGPPKEHVEIPCSSPPKRQESGALYPPSSIPIWLRVYPKGINSRGLPIHLLSMHDRQYPGAQESPKVDRDPGPESEATGDL